MVRLRAPTARVCERCGRREEWRDEGWRVAVDDGEPVVGERFCLHEWDINGTFAPVVESDA
ncbi:MAG: hypothetical protein A07HB70_01402 [uncultured archaeon A07HB70]|jgi:hypothetical protein|nr:MAG: hypothetical protein A07HB70_01402 [uncultured archaeon A07HB70]